MEKKAYSKPVFIIENIDMRHTILIGSGAYTDDPKNPRVALSRQGRFTTSDYDWSEEDE